MKTPIILFIFMLCSFFSYSQVDQVFTGRLPDSTAEKPPAQKNRDWLERVTWGGNFQAWVGNPTFVFLSPTLGYIPFSNFNIGIGVIYNYSSYRNAYGSYGQNIFGGHSYLRYVIAESYFVQTQFDRLHQPDLMSLDPNAKRWVNYLLVGGGFRQSVSEKTALLASVMVNLTPDQISIYPSRVIVQFGLVGTF